MKDEERPTLSDLGLTKKEVSGAQFLKEVIHRIRQKEGLFGSLHDKRNSMRGPSR
ncbi:MAG: hypothetical protein ABSH06_29395 [Thermodesulfobacteriota bacterium]